MLTLRQLTVLRAVCETGSFTAAARRLYLTQSAVSHTIRELEQSAGTVLFDRYAKRVEPTPQGRLLLEEAMPILAACEALESRLPHLEQRAPVHIVSSITIAALHLPHALRRFEQYLPAVPVRVRVVSAGEATTTLREGRADLALLEGARPQGPFVCRPFSRYALKLVCAPGHPLAGRVLDPGELCEQPLLLREPGSAVRDALDSELLRLGYTADPVWESVNSAALLEAARAGLGIAVLPQGMLDGELCTGRLAQVEVRGLSLQNEMFAVWHRDKRLSPALETLLGLL